MEENLGTSTEPVSVPKTFSQEEVNRIAAERAARAAEKARRDAEEKYRQESEAIRSQQEQRNATVSREVDADAIYQQIQEKWNREQAALRQKMEEEQLKARMSEVANSYTSKMAEGKKYHDDFEEVMKDHDATAFPQLTFLISGIENAAPVLYDLMKNPTKLAAMDHLARVNPTYAQSQLRALSQSIRANREAQEDAQSQQVPDPLDRLNPSRVAGSNGKMSLRDLKNQSWLRG